MQHWYYLLALCGAFGSLVYADYKKRLAWFWNARLTAVILGLNLVFFVGWDIVNISAGVIATNQSWVMGLHLITPNLPLEEFMFLTLLGYQTLLLWRWLCSPTSS